MKNYLRERRKELGYSIRQVAGLVGMSTATLSWWERGNTNKINGDSWEYVIALAALYKTDTDRIIDSIRDNFLNRDVIQKKNIKKVVKETPNNEGCSIKAPYIFTDADNEIIGMVKMSQEQIGAVKWILEAMNADECITYTPLDINSIKEA